MIHMGLIFKLIGVLTTLTTTVLLLVETLRRGAMFVGFVLTLVKVGVIVAFLALLLVILYLLLSSNKHETKIES
jgi:hypothetical protein